MRGRTLKNVSLASWQKKLNHTENSFDLRHFSLNRKNLKPIYAICFGVLKIKEKNMLN